MGRQTDKSAKYVLHEIVTSAKEKIKIGEGEYEVPWEMTILGRVAREALVEELAFT